MSKDKDKKNPDYDDPDYTVNWMNTRNQIKDDSSGTKKLAESSFDATDGIGLPFADIFKNNKGKNKPSGLQQQGNKGKAKSQVNFGGSVGSDTTEGINNPFEGEVNKHKKDVDEKEAQKLKETEERRKKIEWANEEAKQAARDSLHQKKIKKALEQEDQKIRDDKKRRRIKVYSTICLIAALAAVPGVLLVTHPEKVEEFHKEQNIKTYNREMNRYTKELRYRAITILRKEGIINYNEKTDEIKVWGAPMPSYYENVKLESLDDVYIYYSILDNMEFNKLFQGNGYRDVIDFLLDKEIIDISEKDYYKDFTFKDLFDMAQKNLENEVRNYLIVNGMLYEIDESNSKGAGRK